MSVSKYKLVLSPNDREINIPIQMNWDYLDRGDSLVEFEKRTVNEILNQEYDFEVARFEHKEIGNKSDINYNFFFAPMNATSANTNWQSSYTFKGLTPQQIYYFSNPFTNSFFKLDFYDSTNQKEQTNYFTVILNTTKSITPKQLILTSQLNVKIPKYKMDYVGNREGFYLYWLKKRDFLNIDTFYMTAKFFNGSNGVFYKMMNRPQSSLTGINKFNFHQENFFYYKVKLDYQKFEYSVYDINNPSSDVLVGNDANPINWYEYINP